MLKICFFLICLIFGFLFLGFYPIDKGTNISRRNKNNTPHKLLSEYGFFEGELKELKPKKDVIPYNLISSLFSDYALKKRFVWMPKGSKAKYTSDHTILEFPKGTILIKTFYYDHVLPKNTTQNIETTHLIKEEENNWAYYAYLWNESQTEASLIPLNRGEIIVPISWLENDETKSVQYSVPAPSACKNCHAKENIVQPIGPKPQNLNKLYLYNKITNNQLSQWEKDGKLASYPKEINTTVDYNDTTQDLNLRARSYLDANCSSCHSATGYCSEMGLDFSFTTSNWKKLGFNKIPNFDNPNFTGNRPYVIKPNNEKKSSLIYRIESTTPGTAMPLLNRSLQHKEGIILLKEWINSLSSN